MSYDAWAPYVPVAQRQADALRIVEKLKKKGMDIQPIQLEKRKLAKTFWGRAWCKHIEHFSDYANRLPRGRTYVRNGSVCHLAIEQEKIIAMVSGSSLYQIEITIKPLSEQKWQAIKKRCAGQIGSLLELLSGQLSDSVMNVVCDPKQGLFPTPAEIQLSCSCPDWATMCKHVAAALYGVAARLDDMPEQLFLLRGVNHEELIDASDAILSATNKHSVTRRRVDDSALSELFGIEMETDMPPVVSQPKHEVPVSTTLEKRRNASRQKKSQTVSRRLPKQAKQTPLYSNKRQAIYKTLKQEAISINIIKSLFPSRLTLLGIRLKRQSLNLMHKKYVKKSK